MARILMIEDDPEISRLVADALGRREHDVVKAAQALEGLRLVLSTTPDVVVLDLGLPDLDGSELVRMIRAVSQVPIIIATARGDDRTAVDLLDAGADDYLVKPYSTDNLEARIRAVLRRVNGAEMEATRIEVGGLELDSASREAALEGRVLELSSKEFDILRLLAERAGEVVSKQEILSRVWPEGYEGSPRTVDVHLSWIRKKLGESAQEPRYLRTVHGVGVKLVEPER